MLHSYNMGFPGSSVGKESACNARDPGSVPGLGRSPGEGKGYLPTAVFWPGEFHELYIQSTKFSRPEYWSGQPIPSPGHLPNPGIQLGSLALQADSLPTELSGKPFYSHK